MKNSVLPAISDITSRHQHAENSIMKLGVSFQGELGEIRHLLKGQIDRQVNADAKGDESFLSQQRQMKNLEAGIETTQQSCLLARESIEKWVESGLQYQEESSRRQKCELEMRLQERDDKIQQLEKQSKEMMEVYTINMNALTDRVAGAGESGRQVMQDALHEYQKALKEGFLRESEESRKRLTQSQEAMKTLQSQVQSMQEQLALVNSGVCAERATSSGEEEKGHITELKQKLEELQAQAEATKKLRGRWQHEIETVDQLRGQLEEMQQILPQMERLDSTLGKMTEMDKIIQSTSHYLNEQQSWVRQELNEKDGEDGYDDITTNDEMDEEPVEDEAAALIEGSLEESLDGQSASKIKVEDEVGSKGCLKKDWTEESVVDVALRRKVTFRSPAGDGSSPSPVRPKEGQEDGQRETLPRRSILKQPHIKGQAGHGGVDDGVERSIGQSRFNRPVVSGESATTKSCSMMAERIRTGFVSGEGQTALAWGKLPTVADFERESQLRNGQKGLRLTVGSKRSSQVEEDDGATGKRGLWLTSEGNGMEEEAARNGSAKAGPPAKRARGWKK